MKKREIILLEAEISDRQGGLRLLTRDNAIRLIKLMKDSSVAIYGFEGFILHPPSGVQPEQDYSRDYSKYTKQESYELCLEYFYKDRSKNVMYDLAYDRSVEQ